MPIEVILHFQNADPVLGEIEEMPDPKDSLIKISNPRHRDGKELPFIQNNVVVVLWSIDQITFIEILPSEAEEEVVGFVRE